MRVHVLWRQNLDYAELLGVYKDQERAQSRLKLLKEARMFGSRYYLDEMELVE